MAAQSTTAIHESVTTYNGWRTFSSVSTGDSSASLFTEALKGFTGGAVLAGTITGSTTVAITGNKIYLDISMDGTNWGEVASGTTTNPSSSTTGWTIDASLINAPYFRLRLTVSTYSGTVTFGYCVKK